MSEHNLTQGNILKQLLRFSLPVLLAQFLQQFYTMADAAILGHFAEDTALAAIGSGSLLLSVLLNFFTGFTTGISVIIAQSYGSGDYKKLKKAIEASLILCIAAGLVFTVLGIAFSESILRYLNTPDSVLDPAKLYFNIGCLRGTGHTMTPMVITMLCYSIFRIVWCRSLLPFFHTMVIIYTSYTVSWVIMLVLLVLSWKYYQQPLYGLWGRFSKKAAKAS